MLLFTISKIIQKFMSKYRINYESFKNKNRNEILEAFLEYITIYDRDDNRIPEFGKKISRKPHLKIFIVRTYNFSPIEIESKLRKYYYDKDIDKKFEDFMNIFVISIEDLNNSNYYLKLENQVTKKKFHFVIFSENQYWTIITLTEKKYLDNTILKIIKKIPELEIIKITPNILENLIHSKQYETYIKGFIAKYKPYQSERKITVDVYGGGLKDLDKIRDIFFVEPTSFAYSLKNSPVGVVEGKIFFDGNFTLERIIKGYAPLAIETIENLTKYYKDINDKLYEQVELYDNVPTLVKDKNRYGLTMKSRYSIVIKIKQNRIKKVSQDSSDNDKITYEELNENIIKYFKNRPTRYQIYSERDYSHFICDKLTRNKVQLTIEPDHNNIILYPTKNCRGITLRDICNGITEVESSIASIESFSYKN